MQIKNIQIEIEKNAKQSAEREYKDALAKCVKILQPFYSPKTRSKETSEDMRDLLKNCFCIGTFGIEVANKRTPDHYIVEKQSEAIANFIDKITHLTEELEEIREIAGER